METTGLLQCWPHSHAPVYTKHVPQYSTTILYAVCTTETGCLMFKIHSVYFWSDNIAVLQTYRVTQKNWNFWKTQQKLKKSKKKNLLTEIEPLQLAF